MKGELKPSTTEVESEINILGSKLMNLSNRERSSILTFEILTERIQNLTGEENGVESEKLSSEIESIKCQIEEFRAGIQEALSNLQVIDSELDEHLTNSQSMEDTANAIFEDTDNAFFNNIKNLSDGSHGLKMRISELKNRIQQIIDTYNRERIQINENLEQRRAKARDFNQFKNNARIIFKSVLNVAKVVGGIALNVAFKAASIAFGVASTAISLLGRGVGIIGKGINKGIWQSGIFKRTGGEYRKINISKSININSSEYCPEVSGTKKYDISKEVFSDSGLRKPSYILKKNLVIFPVGNSHFTWDKIEKEWHVTTEIGGLKQGRRIAKHDFLRDFDFLGGKSNRLSETSKSVRTKSEPVKIEKNLPLTPHRKSIDDVVESTGSSSSLDSTTNYNNRTNIKSQMQWEHYYRYKNNSRSDLAKNSYASQPYESFYDKQHRFREWYKINDYYILDKDKYKRNNK